MILAVDVQYEGRTGYCAGVMFKAWGASEADRELTYIHKNVCDYVPGQFYKRELPCILGFLRYHKLTPSLIIVDGFVVLGQAQKPGLGKYLYDALDARVPIIGVAKSAFRGSAAEQSVLRGTSQNPLYVSAAGIDAAKAKQHISNMHGAFRMPTLLTRVDQLARASAGKQKS